jgi:hypothetical protein
MIDNRLNHKKIIIIQPLKLKLSISLLRFQGYNNNSLFR